jgi:CHAD domain-containing protein
MPLERDKLEKPFNSLRKLLKKLPKQPSPEEVHDIRTRTRRVEATLDALQLDRKRRGKRVLAAITPIRRRAGKVRDMDVFSGFASNLFPNGEKDCVVRFA